MRQQTRMKGHPQLSGRRILLIEDDWFIADALASLLDGEGIEVVGPAATLDEAQRLADTHPFDLAVVDLNLGGTRADTIVDRLLDSRVPVIIVSAYETHDFTDRVFATLQKPVAATALIRALARAAEMAAPPDPSK